VSKNRLYKIGIMARGKTVNKLFVNRLRTKLVDKNLSQSDLAYMSNIAQGAISEYLNPEKGRSPGAAELGRMAQALGVSMGWLWGVEDTSDIETAIYTQRIHRLEGRLLFAKKTLRGALEYLEEEIDDDKKLVTNTLSIQNDCSSRVAEDETEYNHNKKSNN
jgi:transcriptional regulator with XRE-family HTH domain